MSSSHTNEKFNSTPFELSSSSESSVAMVLSPYFSVSWEKD